MEIYHHFEGPHFKLVSSRWPSALCGWIYILLNGVRVGVKSAGLLYHTKWQKLWFSNFCETVSFPLFASFLLCMSLELHIDYYEKLLWAHLLFITNGKSECPYQKENYIKSNACLVKDWKRYVVFFCISSASMLKHLFPQNLRLWWMVWCKKNLTLTEGSSVWSRQWKQRN